MKLSTELGKRATGHTIYILDEPTTGLHFEDVRRLLDVLQRLVDDGQHDARDRAQPRRDQVGRLDRRPRARRRRRAAARSSPKARPSRSRRCPRATPAGSSRRCSASTADAAARDSLSRRTIVSRLDGIGCARGSWSAATAFTDGADAPDYARSRSTPVARRTSTTGTRRRALAGRWPPADGQTCGASVRRRSRGYGVLVGGRRRRIATPTPAARTASVARGSRSYRPRRCRRRLPRSPAVAESVLPRLSSCLDARAACYRHWRALTAESLALGASTLGGRLRVRLGRSAAATVAAHRVRSSSAIVEPRSTVAGRGGRARRGRRLGACARRRRRTARVPRPRCSRVVTVGRVDRARSAGVARCASRALPRTRRARASRRRVPFDRACRATPGPHGRRSRSCSRHTRGRRRTGGRGTSLERLDQASRPRRRAPAHPVHSGRRASWHAVVVLRRDAVAPRELVARSGSTTGRRRRRSDRGHDDRCRLRHVDAPNCASGGAASLPCACPR